MFNVHPTTAAESNRTRPTMVLDGPMFIPLTMSYTNCCMNLQLPHVESRPYTKFGSASHILPESSSTKTRSISLVHPDNINIGDDEMKTEPNYRTIDGLMDREWNSLWIASAQWRHQLKNVGLKNVSLLGKQYNVRLCILVTPPLHQQNNF